MTIADYIVIVFPTGITVRKSDVFAFDLELAPVIQNDPRNIDLTLHPGVAWVSGMATPSVDASRLTSAESRGDSHRCLTRVYCRLLRTRRSSPSSMFPFDSRRTRTAWATPP